MAVSESAGAEKFFQFRFVKIAEIPCFEHAEFNAGDLRSFQTETSKPKCSHIFRISLFLPSWILNSKTVLSSSSTSGRISHGAVLPRIDLHALAQGLENVIAHLGTDGNAIGFCNMMRRMHKPVGKRAVIR